MKQMFLPFLSVLFLNFGINIKLGAQCNVSISETANGLEAFASGDSNAVFYYDWDNGTSGPVISNPVSGQTYCVNVFDSINACYAYACYTYQDSTGVGTGGNCSVVIIPTGPPDSTNYLVAQPGSVGSYSFVWNTGDSTQLINMFNVPGIYCVTMTDTTTGCTASSCFVVNPLGNYCGNDSVYIVESVNGLEAIIVSQDSNATFSMAWNDGTPGSIIVNPVSGQTYCVTLFNTLDSTCFASSCYTFQDSTGSNCNVIIYESFPVLDSLSAAPTTPGNYSFVWSTGETTQNIALSLPGVYCVTITDSISGCTDTACYTYQDSTTLVLEFNAMQNIRIYPNPAYTSLFLAIDADQNASAQITVYDVLGQVVENQNISIQSGNNTLPINVLDLKPGVYFVSYTQGQATKTLRFLKQ